MLLLPRGLLLLTCFLGARSVLYAQGDFVEDTTSEDIVIPTDDMTLEISDDTSVEEPQITFEENSDSDQEPSSPRYKSTPIFAVEDTRKDLPPKAKKPVIPPLDLANVQSYTGGGANYYSIESYLLQCHTRHMVNRGHPLVPVTAKKAGPKSKSYLTYDPQEGKFRFLVHFNTLKDWWYDYLHDQDFPCELTMKVKSKATKVEKRLVSRFFIETTRFPGAINTNWEKVQIKRGTHFSPPFHGVTIGFAKF